MKSKNEEGTKFKLVWIRDQYKILRFVLRLNKKELKSLIELNLLKGKGCNSVLQHPNDCKQMREKSWNAMSVVAYNCWEKISQVISSHDE